MGGIEMGIKKTNLELSDVTKKLEAIATIVNKKIFKNEIKEKIIFNVQSRGRRKNCYGWLTVDKVWRSTENIFREINICSEILNDSREVVATLIHELVHAYNAERDIDDCASNGYHNKKFGNKAESIGFKIDHSKRHGYAHTSIVDGSELDKFVLSLNLKKSDFSLVRIEKAAKKSITKMKKWECSCGMIVRCSKELNATCNECDTEFVIEEEIEEEAE
tara:strand:+ start:230 stop:886 length:657 start_codon:yes stop_codon:yes gene_type:complete